MRLMWLARLARPDLLRVTSWLATKIHVWSTSCDAIPSPCNLLLESHQRTDAHRTHWGLIRRTFSSRCFVTLIFVEIVTTVSQQQVDGFSCQGGPQSYPLAWISKKQSAISRSIPLRPKPLLWPSCFLRRVFR